MENKSIKAYKVFSPDWTCRGFKFGVGKSYDTGKPPIICESGFHACIKAADCFNYYDFNSSNKVAEVEFTGIVVGLDNGNKIAGDKITIVREISWIEVLDLVNIGKNNTGYGNTGNCNTGNWNTGDGNTGYGNTGYGNTGDRNTGNWNTGDRNTGNCNTGNWNTGNCNTGNWNTGNCNTGNWNTGNWNNANSETGFFNTIQSEYVNVFNKPCKKSNWNSAIKPSFLYFNLTEFISESDMNDLEKELNPNYKTLGGYLKRYSYKEAFKKSWDKATNEDKTLLEKLPNFDWEVFTEISGIEKP